jgi:2-polyprenyl-3-methyl-5-hydroxy-6-metoxy-1,4-benzoquinol methylase
MDNSPRASAISQPAAADAQQLSPSPTLFFETVNAYQRTAAVKSAIELELFTAIAEGAETAQALAERCRVSPRGVRILADFLVIAGFLAKDGDRYSLTHDSFVFLNRRSPAYLGSAVEFLLNPAHVEAFSRLTDVVRRGTAETSHLAPDNPLWVVFARAMAPMMALPAQLMADALGVRNAGFMKVLDIAAGHGLFGIAVAGQNAAAEVVGLDWQSVLAVAQENAAAAGVASRYSTRIGDALTMDLGGDYDLVLVPNFLHHFDRDTCTAFLAKVHAALAQGGRVAILEFVPDESRVEPAPAASFAMTMLALTPGGDAYTFDEIRGMLVDAGFQSVTAQPIPPMQTLVAATR